jgi:hypothetical protein
MIQSREGGEGHGPGRRSASWRDPARRGPFGVDLFHEFLNNIAIRPIFPRIGRGRDARNGVVFSRPFGRADA